MGSTEKAKAVETLDVWRFAHTAFGIESPFWGLLVLLLILALSGLAYRLRPKLRHAIDDENNSGKFLPQLEGLRGLMAALVVIHHGMISFVVLPATGIWDLPNSVFYTEIGIVPVLFFSSLQDFYSGPSCLNNLVLLRGRS